MIDLEAVRNDTVGVDAGVHLNNCGSSLPPRAVVEAQIAYLREEERHGGYETADTRRSDLDDFADATAVMLGCRADEIAFQHSASEAWWKAFSSVSLQPGQRVVVGTSEFQANAFGLLQARDRGVTVDVAPTAGDGTIDLDWLDRSVASGVDLVGLTYISLANGAVQPAADVGALCASAGVPFLLDACQAAGQMPLDVDALACDFLVYTGRKFMRGPRGTGVLYARQSMIDRLGATPFVDGLSAVWTDDDRWYHADGARRFEFGERNYAGQVGLAVATRYALDIGLASIEERVVRLAADLRSGLSEISGISVCDEGTRRCGIVTFVHEDLRPEDLAAALADAGISIGVTERRNAQWDLGRRGLSSVARIGVHYFNTDDDVHQTIEVLRSVIEAGRSPA